MTIARAAKPENRYKAICVQGLEDSRLSWKAKGILSYLLTRPDNWQPRLNHLMTVSKDGRDSTASGLKELKEFGYYQQIFHRDVETGQITSRENRVVECPQSNIVPFARKANGREKPCSGKSDATNKGFQTKKMKQQTTSCCSDLDFEQEEPTADRPTPNSNSDLNSVSVQSQGIGDGEYSAAPPNENLIAKAEQAIGRTLPRAAVEVIHSHPESVVMDAIAATQEAKQEGRIKNSVVGYLISAIRGQWQPNNDKATTGEENQKAEFLKWRDRALAAGLIEHFSCSDWEELGFAEPTIGVIRKGGEFFEDWRKLAAEFGGLIV